MREMETCSDASPAPSTQIGSFGKSFARSSLTSTSAPPPSVTRQQLNRCSGQVIRREFSTSSVVIGSRIIARGLSDAHLRVVTATSAKSSSVVPKCAMWRTWGIENIEGGPTTP